MVEELTLYYSFYKFPSPTVFKFSDLAKVPILDFHPFLLIS
jgi:hypothetical protein